MHVIRLGRLGLAAVLPFLSSLHYCIFLLPRENNRLWEDGRMEGWVVGFMHCLAVPTGCTASGYFGYGVGFFGLSAKDFPYLVACRAVIVLLLAFLLAKPGIITRPFPLSTIPLGWRIDRMLSPKRPSYWVVAIMVCIDCGIDIGITSPLLRRWKEYLFCLGMYGLAGTTLFFLEAEWTNKQHNTHQPKKRREQTTLTSFYTLLSYSRKKHFTSKYSPKGDFGKQIPQ
ncbi:hypothetical protein V8F06_003217 [Rhypophila decipiens]